MGETELYRTCSTKMWVFPKKGGTRFYVNKYTRQLPRTWHLSITTERHFFKRTWPNRRADPHFWLFQQQKDIHNGLIFPEVTTSVRTQWYKSHQKILEHRKQRRRKEKRFKQNILKSAIIWSPATSHPDEIHQINRFFGSKKPFWQGPRSDAKMSRYDLPSAYIFFTNRRVKIQNRKPKKPDSSAGHL